MEISQLAPPSSTSAVMMDQLQFLCLGQLMSVQTTVVVPSFSSDRFHLILKRTKYSITLSAETITCTGDKVHSS